LTRHRFSAPPKGALAILGNAARRGVDVRLLLPGRTDVPIVRHAGHGYFLDLLRLGIRIFEYRDAILHAKSLVADEYVSVVGSTNFDFRSFRFNGECNLVILDEGTGHALGDAVREDLSHSEEIRLDSWTRRPHRHRLGDALARRLGPVL